MSVAIQILEVRPGMVYQGQLIIAIERYGFRVDLHFKGGKVLSFTKDTYLTIDGSEDG